MILVNASTGAIVCNASTGAIVLTSNTSGCSCCNATYNCGCGVNTAGSWNVTIAGLNQASGCIDPVGFPPAIGAGGLDWSGTIASNAGFGGDCGVNYTYYTGTGTVPSGTYAGHTYIDTCVIQFKVGVAAPNIRWNREIVGVTSFGCFLFQSNTTPTCATTISNSNTTLGGTGTVTVTPHA